MDHRKMNESAFRALKPALDQTYPKGRFVALHAGQVVADADSVVALLAAVQGLGKNPDECLAVQAGVEYPEFGLILIERNGP
jgi:hypothetical protein